MWHRCEDDSRTLWMDITARDRNFTISLFGQGRGVIAKDSQVLEEETYRNLREALDELTDPTRPAQPDAFSNFGSLLFELALPEAIQLPLLKHDGPLVFSTHELSLPWELLCANDRYLCLKHSVSRQLPVLAAMQNALLGDSRVDAPDAMEDAALIISNPTGDLPSAAEEAEELREIFTRVGLRCDALIGPKECTYANVMAARLRKHSYRIIHFSGHAEYLEPKGTSAIHLADGRMIMAQEIQRIFKGEPLVFLNACWSALGEGGQRRSGPPGSGSHVVKTLTEAFTFGNRCGRARAIIGSMWWIADNVAKGLAGCFYQEVLAGHPLGEALRRARERVAGSVNDPALWSTYVLFGDPHQRVAAPGLVEPATSPEPVPATNDSAAQVSIPENAEVEPPAPPIALRDAPEEAQAHDSGEEADNSAADLPWSDEVCAAFVGAMAAMSAMHWKVFSTVHLILGLTYVENGLIATALTRCRVNPQTARRTLRDLFTIPQSDQSPGESIISDNLSGVLKSAQESARIEGAAEVCEAHIVRALLDRPESGGTMMLTGLHVDLDELRRELVSPSATPPPSASELSTVRVAAESPDARPAAPMAAPEDLMLPSGDLNRAMFDTDAGAALEEAALMAGRSFWADLRSPHLFLGALGRRNSRLADFMTTHRVAPPQALGDALLASLTNPPDASLKPPKLHREFLSENALRALRSSRQRARLQGRVQITERDILAAILEDDSNIISSTLRRAGIDPRRLLWPET